MSTRVIDFFYDIGSPYSYLAATQVDAVGARHGVPVRWRPFLLGAVFKATGNVMPASIAAKARWMLDDLQRWAAHYGVPFRMSSHFPLNTLRTQRVLTAAGLADTASLPRLSLALYRAYWAEDRNVAVDEEIARAAGVAGLDGARLLAAAELPETKDALRATTDEAIARGAFGAPTICV